MTSPSTEHANSNVARAWKDKCAVSLSSWALDFADTLLHTDDRDAFAEEATHLANVLAVYKECDDNEPWHQERSLSMDIMVALDMAFSKYGFFFAHQACVGASNTSADFVAFVPNDEHPHHRPIAFGECKVKDSILTDKFRAQVSSEAHYFVRRYTTPIRDESSTGPSSSFKSTHNTRSRSKSKGSQVDSSASSVTRPARFTQVLPPMLNINANQDLLQFQLVIFVTPTEPIARMASVDRGQNAMVVIPLALLETAKMKGSVEHLRRALVAVHGLLTKLASVDPSGSWDEYLKLPAEGYTFAELLSPTTQLWRSSSNDKMVVKVYDYYLKRCDDVNKTSDLKRQYRSPLPEGVLEKLSGNHPVYCSWKLVTLLKDHEGTPLVQQVHYPFMEGSHMPQSLGQFGTVLDLIHELHTVHEIVFGDVLLRNIVFPCLAIDPAMVIDFDLWGRAGKDKYPRNYNVGGDLEEYRHPGAAGGKIMETSHDCFALAAIAKRLWPTQLDLHELLLAGKLQAAIEVCHESSSSKPTLPPP